MMQILSEVRYIKGFCEIYVLPIYPKKLQINDIFLELTFQSLGTPLIKGFSDDFVQRFSLQMNGTFLEMMTESLGSPLFIGVSEDFFADSLYKCRHFF